MFDRPGSGEAVVLVYVTVKQLAISSEDSDEFYELAVSAGIKPLDRIFVHCDNITAKFFIGSGKVEEIQKALLFHQANLVIFNQSLSPAQTRNLEEALECRVIDRTDLILDIFAQRARSFEGKLQVELAQLQHLSTRLVRGWSHLERQKGGIGLRGPGETQLEVDRRLIRLRIKAITSRLDKVQNDRHQRRRTRQRADIFTVAIVGYTNAGKSTLFNTLSDSTAYTANQLFATLDPTIRQVTLPGLGKVALADTVGFIRDLPHGLIKAFHATLEETRGADLLLHVVDASDPDHQEKIDQVLKVLKEIDAEAVPQLMVYNKIDLLDNVGNRADIDGEGRVWRVWLSAKNGKGLSELRQIISTYLDQDVVQCEICLLPTQGKLRHYFYDANAVMSETLQLDGSYKLVVRLPKRKLDALLRKDSSAAN